MALRATAGGPVDALRESIHVPPMLAAGEVRLGPAMSLVEADGLMLVEAASIGQAEAVFDGQVANVGARVDGSTEAEVMENVPIAGTTVLGAMELLGPGSPGEPNAATTIAGAAEVGAIDLQDPEPANLLTNGGLEAWAVSPGLPDGWSNESGNASQNSKETALVAEGLNSWKIVPDGSGGGGSAGGSRTITGLTAGKSYLAEVLTRGDGVNGKGKFCVRNVTAGVNMGSNGGFEIGTTSLEWQVLRMSFVAEAGQTYNLRALDAGGGIGAACYFDHIRIIGIQAKDDSGVGNHGALKAATNAAGPKPGAAGLVGLAYSFDGVNDRVDVPDHASLDLTGALTIEAVVRATALNHAGGGNLPRIIDKTDYILLFTQDGKVRFQLDLNGVTTASDSAAGVVAAGNWYHVLGSYGGALMVTRLNGATVASRAAAGPIDTNASVVRIGDNGSMTRCWSGLMEEVRLYNREVTANDAAYLWGEWNAGRRPGLDLPDDAGVRSCVLALRFGEPDERALGSKVLLPSLEAIGAPGVGGALAATVEQGARIASKDVYVPTDKTLGVCNDNFNKNGDDVRVSSVAALVCDGYVAWDLAGLPAGATVTAAELQVNVAVAPIGASDVEVYKLLDADEAWTEAMTCSNAKAPDGASLQTINFDTSTGQKVFALNAAWLARIQERLGVGPVSMLLRMATATRTVVLDDRESGASLGPRLKLTFTLP